MTAAVFGGTFDPFHIGHLAMVRAALRELQPDRLWVVPTGNPPYRQQSGKITAGELRLRMAEDAAADLTDPAARSRIEVLPDEIRREGLTYTADTVAELHSRYPGCRLILVCGADSLLTMHRWVRISDVFSLAEAACFLRPGEAGRKTCDQAAALLAERFNARITFLQASIPDVSASLIRERVRRGEDISRFVSPSVRRDIEQFGLYRD